MTISPESRPRRDGLMLTALLSCTGASILSTDLYTPSLPHLPAELGATPQAVQLTMSLNLATFAAFQLLYGPLADRVGRKTLLIWGLIGFLLATLACAVAPTVEFLIVARVFQGAFASAEAVVTLLMLRELFTGDQATRAMGLFGVGVGAFPALGPLIGGYVHVLAGWRANFVLMAIMIAVAGLLAVLVLPETRARDPEALRLGRIGRTYLSLVKDRTVLRYAVPLAAAMGGLFAFATAGPFILIDRLQVPTEEYGYWYAVMVVFFILGSLAVNRLAGRVKVKSFCATGMVLILIGGALFVAPLLAGYERLWSIIAAISVFGVGIGLLFGSAPLLLLDAAGEDRRGGASALTGMVELGGAAIGAFAVGSFHDGTAMPCAVTMAAWAAIGAVAFWALRD